MAYVPIRPKFLRGLIIPAGGPAGTVNSAIGKNLKVLYEFWGYCVNGGDDLLIPGGFAPISGVNMPAGFENGPSVLIASGSDGSTVFDTKVFHSSKPTAFSPSMAGKHITLWKSGSTSTEDSVYEISRWLTSSSVLLDPVTGGTVTSVTGSVPVFTDRTDINWRINDLHGGIDSMSSWFSGMNMVFQFDDAPIVNPGQARSQAMVRAVPDFGFGSTVCGRINIVLSPSGSWNGTQFVSESIPDIIPEVGFTGTGGWVDPSWAHGYDFTREGSITIIADKTFLFFMAGGPMWVYDPSELFIEIPERLYSPELDPNPICASNFGNIGIDIGSSAGFGYPHRFFPSPYDPSLRRWGMQTRSMYSTYWHNRAYSVPRFPSGVQSVVGSIISKFKHFHNEEQDKFMMSDPILSCATMMGMSSSLGQYCVGRARVRSMRFCSVYNDLYMRVGDDDDRWIHAAEGMMLPWDHAIIPKHRLFRGNV